MHSTSCVLHNRPDNRANWSESGDSTTARVHLVDQRTSGGSRTAVAVKWVGAPVYSSFFSKKQTNKQGSKRTVLTYSLRLCCTPSILLCGKAVVGANPSRREKIRGKLLFFLWRRFRRTALPWTSCWARSTPGCSRWRSFRWWWPWSGQSLDTG